MHESTQTFLKDIKSSGVIEFLAELYPDNIFIYLGGSRLYDCLDERSDYDLVVIVENNLDKHEEYKLEYNGKHVHWIVQTYESLFGISNRTLNLVGNMQLHYLTDDYVLYVNKSKKKMYNIVKKNKEAIAKRSSFLLYEELKSLVIRCLADKTLDNNKSKMLYHLCNAYYILNEEQPDIEFLKVLKRIRWQETPQDIKDKCLEIFNKFKLFAIKEYLLKAEVNRKVRQIKEEIYNG